MYCQVQLCNEITTNIYSDVNTAVENDTGKENADGGHHTSSISISITPQKDTANPSMCTQFFSISKTNLTSHNTGSK